MQKPIIVVAGATGNLGSHIVKYLLTLGADVRALVRPTGKPDKIKALEQWGATIITTQPGDLAATTEACKNASCVVSALAGLEETIIDYQTLLLNAAVAAGVPRFIPSDYSIDFTRFTDGGNRNLDLRRKFHSILEQAPIAATSIFNGAFADLLTGQMPMVLFKKNLVIYWGDADHKLAFTSVDNVAAYTAHAALDNHTPKKLIIAGDQISAREITDLMTGLTGRNFKMLRTGSQGLLGVIIKVARFFNPAKNDLYPAWQGMQYMHNMVDERAVIDHTDNNRYPGMKWTTVKQLLQHFLK